ncbi:MAG: nitroreductase family protein [Tepidiformaceae bacterium]
MVVDMNVIENDIFEVIGTQRAMRRLKPDPVPEALIKRVLWAATRAPNGGNVQPWRFLVVTEAAKKRRLQEIYAAEWAKYLAPESAATREEMTAEQAASKARTTAAGQYLADHLHEAPAIIIPCGFLLAVNTGIASGSSIYPAIQNLMLAARALGLGTVMTTLHRHNEGAVRELLGIPENAHSAAMIPIGWPMGRFGAGPRLPVEAVTYWDSWGAKRP